MTTGVAPLLFIQLLYGQLFYAATVLVGWLWLAIVPLIVVGYYAVYLYKFEVGAPGGTDRLAGRRGPLLRRGGAVQVLVNVLQLTPPRWEAVAAARRGGLPGPDRPAAVPALRARLAGGGGDVPGRRGGGARRAGRRTRSSTGWLAAASSGPLAATGLQMVDGFWFLFALPRESVDRAGGRDRPWPTLHLAIGHGAGIPGADPAVRPAGAGAAADRWSGSRPPWWASPCSP